MIQLRVKNLVSSLFPGLERRNKLPDAVVQLF